MKNCIAMFHGKLNVLRVVVLAANNKQVFEPAGDEKLAIVNESQVACAQKWPGTASINVGMECVRRFFRRIPAARCHTRPFHPNLADLLCGAELNRIYNGNLLVRQTASTADQRVGSRAFASKVDLMIFKSLLL